MFEGNIMLAEDQKFGNASDEDAVVHNARKGKQWKEYGKGVVPYLITGSFTENQRKEKKLRKALKHFMTKPASDSKKIIQKISNAWQNIIWIFEVTKINAQAMLEVKNHFQSSLYI